MREFDHLKLRFLSLGIRINEQYLDRYLRFVLNAREVSKKTSAGESHHILPKAKDMFPHLRKISWNQKVLTPRAHFHAHCLLTRALPGNVGQALAYDSMRKALYELRSALPA